MVKSRKVDLGALRNWPEFFNKLLGMDAARVPDRVIVIMAVAYIEELLNQLLRGFFIDEVGPAKPNAETEADRLLKPGMPVGDFASKARLAYCLGLLWEEWYRDLKTIASIRNAFAHHFDDVSFSDPWVTDRCHELQIPKLSGFGEFSQDQRPTPRDYFMESVSMLMSWIPGGYKDLQPPVMGGQIITPEEEALHNAHYERRRLSTQWAYISRSRSNPKA
jgi:DNA-binding MltR family transcriptional regulator